MAKRKPDRIDRAATKIVNASVVRHTRAEQIAALVRREVRRERKAMREELARITYAKVTGYKPERCAVWKQCLDMLGDWLDARESR